MGKVVKYEDNNPDYIECLVLSYKNGDKIAAEDLLDCFRPIIEQYISIIFYSKKVNVTQQLKLFFRCASCNTSDSKMMDNRLKFLRAIYPDTISDFTNSMFAIILTLAKRYEYKDRSFVAYFATAFPFEVYRFFEKNYMHEPLCKNDSLLYIDEFGINNPIFSGKFQREDIFDEISNNMYDCWLSDGICSDVLSDLTSSQRLMLYEYYHLCYTDKQIAKLLRMPRNTLNKKRNKIIDKIKKDKM